MFNISLLSNNQDNFSVTITKKIDIEITLLEHKSLFSLSILYLKIYSKTLKNEMSFPGSPYELYSHWLQKGT